MHHICRRGGGFSRSQPGENSRSGEMETESPITTPHPFSAESGMRGPKLLLRHARLRCCISGVAVGDDEDRNGKGWLR
jgi:hypothetical protein